VRNEDRRIGNGGERGIGAGAREPLGGVWRGVELVGFVDEEGGTVLGFECWVLG